MAKKEANGMKKSTWIWIGVAVVALILIMWVVSARNNFVGLNEDVNGKWSEVENQYQTQADKIPNLVSVVKSVVTTETKFVKDVVDARNAYDSATTPLAKDTAGQQMTNVITNLRAVAEQYPVLQATKNYIQLMDEISGIQNRIATARTRYIESVQKMNTAVKRFPGNVIAGMFGFKTIEYYTAEAGTTTPSLGDGKL